MANTPNELNCDSNIPSKIWNLRNRKLHNIKNHPIQILKTHIYKYFGSQFKTFDNLNNTVHVTDNFDKLLIPSDHVCRSRSDTYYVNKEYVLRTQTSSHQNEVLEQDITKFLITGDVYRKDEVDRTHYPVFHQMEGLCIVDDGIDPATELHKVLGGLVEYLFPGCKYRVNDDYFPFTNPSWEYEIKYKDGPDDDEKNWLEILGCGITQPKILENCGYPGKTAWAFGLGLERLAMYLFDIPDIRIFWSDDEKFLSQFSSGKIIKFVPYSVLDPLEKDISFWIPEDCLHKNDENITNSVWKNQNDFYDFIRSHDENNMIENILCFDTFFHPKKNMLSHAYRIKYSPPDSQINDPALFTELTNKLHQSYYQTINDKLGITYR